MSKTTTPRTTRSRKRAMPAEQLPETPPVQTASTTEPKRPTWKEDLAEVQRVGFWLWLCVLWIPSLTLSALSGPEVPTVVLKAVQNGSMGPKEAVAALEDTFVGLVKSVKFDADGKPTWSLPEGWTQEPGNQIR